MKVANFIKVFFNTMKRIGVILLTIIALMSFSKVVLAQETSHGAYIDSLIDLAKKSKNDTLKAEICNKISWGLRNSDPSEAIRYSMDAIEAAGRTDNFQELIRGYSYIGVCHRNLGNNSEALQFYWLGLDAAKKYGFKVDEAYGYNNLGNILLVQEDYVSALKYLDQALKVAKELADSSILGYVYLNLGRSYLGLKKFLDAKKCLEEALKIRTLIGASEVQIHVVEKALGDYYCEIDSIDKAKDILSDCMQHASFKTDYDLASSLCFNFSCIYLKEEKYDSALYYANLAVEKAKLDGGRHNIKNAYNAVSNVYIAQGMLKEAVDNYYCEISYTDSIFNDKLMEKLYNIQFSAEQHKKQLMIEGLTEEKIIHQNTISVLGLIVLLALTIVFLLFYNYRKIKRLNNQLHIQQKQISDSIVYAQKIQNAILPDIEVFGNVFSDKFVLYMPRDVVSGDFYWSYNTLEYEIIVVADCTGHGVPGAFMSMLGASALHDIASEGEISSSAILEKLRKKVKTLMHQTLEGNTQKDGMDMALMVINRQTKVLDYSGAYISLIYIRDNQINTLKAVRNPIGIYRDEKPFVSIKLLLQEGDCIYLSSDGYCSQFGGTKKLKFRPDTYKSLLLDNHQRPMREQMEVLKNAFYQWKGDLKQVDDILVAGFRV